MWLFIQPNDTLFFRDGRPFDAGADVWTGTIFPPYPATIYGMLRTFFINMVSTNIDHADYFANIPDEYKGLLGKKDEYGSLSLVGPFLGRRITIKPRYGYHVRPIYGNGKRMIKRNTISYVPIQIRTM